LKDKKRLKFWKRQVTKVGRLQILTPWFRLGHILAELTPWWKESCACLHAHTHSCLPIKQIEELLQSTGRSHNQMSALDFAMPGEAFGHAAQRNSSSVSVLPGHEGTW